MRLFLLTLCLTGLLSAARKPNVVYILADDLGWADTSVYGYTQLYKTPNLDRLAKRGMTFTRAYAASPLCSPTRSSILTGLNPATTMLTTPNCHTGKPILTASKGESSAPPNKAVQPNPVNRLDTKYYTLAESFRDSGYATAHFGKWHLGAEPHSPIEHGFDLDIPHWHGPGPAGSFVAPWKYPDFDPNTPNEHIEDRMAQEAVVFIEKNKDKPFFLNYWMFSVHAPFDAKKDLIEKYRKLVDPKDAQRSPTYAAMVESMDDAVGTLIDTLDRLELTDNTIIVFFSDNGGNMYNEVDGTTPTSNRPLRGGKATMFEGGVRVPMIVAWPGHLKPASTNDTLVQSIDFFPTFAELLDLKTEENQKFDGISLAKAFEGESLDRGPIFTYFPHNPPVPDWLPPSVSVHYKHWKLIREFFQGENQAHRYHLYDLNSDLGEKNNLAKENPDTVRELDQLITEFLKKSEAVLPIPNPAFDPQKYKPELVGVGKIRNKPTAKPAPKDDSFRKELQGWKARNSQATVKDGIVTLKGTAPDPFLGTGATQFSGPSKITFRILALKGGDGKVSWANNTPKPQSVPFSLKKGKWTELTLDLPAEGSLGIMRLHLPAGNQAIRVDWIKLVSGSTSENWAF